jgi:hypothetical protein
MGSKNGTFQATDTHKFLLLSTVLNLDVRLSRLVNNFEGEALDIGLHLCIFVFAANETLRERNSRLHRYSMTE